MFLTSLAFDNTKESGRRRGRRRRGSIRDSDRGRSVPGRRDRGHRMPRISTRFEQKEIAFVDIAHVDRLILTE